MLKYIHASLKFKKLGIGLVLALSILRRLNIVSSHIVRVVLKVVRFTQILIGLVK